MPGRRGIAVVVGSRRAASPRRPTNPADRDPSMARPAPPAALAALILLAALWHSVDGQFRGLQPQAAEEVFRAFANLQKCRRATGTSDEEVRLMIETRSVPASRNGHCLLACMAQSYGLMPNGRFSPEAAMQLTDSVLQRVGRQDPQLRAKVQQLVQTCGRSVGSDACETAAAVATCGLQETNKLRSLLRGR